jgi:glycosyltransferase involved in cell wall biosynthesis
MRISLLVPSPLQAISGGYAYDRAMLAGLRAAGHDAQAVELAGRHPLADAAARASAGAAFDSLQADVVPVIDGFGLPAFCDRAAALAARRTIGLIHHPTALETGYTEADSAALRAAERTLMPLLTRVVVTSPATADRLVADFGVEARRIHVVVPGTDDAPRSAGSGGSGCAILSVGTLVPRKGHDVLLRALAKLFDLDWRLVIVGSAERDPVHARALHALAEQLGISQRVHFAGEADAATLAPLWHGADIFALATYWEGYGMAIAEALKRGIPVAVTAGGAAAALVSPLSGVVCVPGDEVMLSKSLRRLIFDRALRQANADAAWAEGRKLPDWTGQVRAFAEGIGG